MPQFCSECGTAVGLFSRRTIKLASGHTAVRCKACETARLFADAGAAEAESSEAGIKAWRKAAKKARDHRTPREALARLYRKTERWDALVEVLEQEAQLVDAEQKHVLLQEMLGLYRDRLHLDMMVVKTLDEILKLDQTDVHVLDQLIGQYEKMNRWTDLISTLRKKAEATLETEARAAIYSRIAELFVTRFANQAEAIAAYERVIELVPTDHRAIEQLKAMHERRRDWEKLIAICRTELDLLDETEQHRRLLYLARIASKKLDRKSELSVELWSKVLQNDPQNLEAAEQLERLATRKSKQRR